MKYLKSVALLLFILAAAPFLQGCDRDVPDEVSLGSDLIRSPEQI